MEWISVKDDLPNTGTKVLCSDQAGVYLAEYTVYGEFYDKSENFSFCCITHWMPLPKPSKKESTLSELFEGLNPNK